MLKIRSCSCINIYVQDETSILLIG